MEVLSLKYSLEFVGVVFEFSAPVLSNFWSCIIGDPFASKFVQFVETLKRMSRWNLFLFCGNIGESNGCHGLKI